MMKTTFAAVALLLTILLFSQSSSALSSKSDVLFVLDNSGSMKKNDPEFLTRKAATNLVEGLSKDSRVGFIIFDDKADISMPLTPVENPDLQKNVAHTMGKLTYSGKYTNIPSAIERAIYDLKQNGRKDAEKLIIFMTDGFIDTGDSKKDAERGKWLKEELTLEASNAGIRIFSVAFTEGADFELIQTLAGKTDGGYYRAIKKEDLQNVFNSIQQAIIKPRTKAAPKAESGTEKEGPLKGLLIVAVVGLIVLGVAVIVVIARGRKREPGDKKAGRAGGVEEKQPAMPDAALEDIESVTGSKEIRLFKTEMTVGRAVADKKQTVDIAIPQNTVSALHASIEYRDKTFFVTDRRSTNRTYLNNQALPHDVPQRLKSGDVISFDKYKFRFIIREQTGMTGTVLRPAAAGGTIIRPQGMSPESKPSQPAPEARPSQRNQSGDDEEGTHVKPTVCELHPSYKATEICPACKKGYCSECMVEKDGKRICRTCAA
jgi:Mg-chelatase subunit ChlD